jgi:hypothetical protein
MSELLKRFSLEQEKISLTHDLTAHTRDKSCTAVEVQTGRLLPMHGHGPGEYLSLSTMLSRQQPDATATSCFDRSVLTLSQRVNLRPWCRRILPFVRGAL